MAAGDRDADGPIGLEHDPQRHRAGDHVEVWALERGAQVRVGRAVAPPVTLGQLEAADALLPGAVEVGVVLVSGRPGGLEHRVDERAHRAALGHLDRTTDTVKLVLAALVVLGPPEVRQHLVVAPAVESRRRPAVVVGPVAADVDHRVDRAAAAQHPPPRQEQPAVAEPGLRLAEQIPVQR